MYPDANRDVFAANAPRPNELIAVADVLGVSVDWLLGRHDVITIAAEEPRPTHTMDADGSVYTAGPHDAAGPYVVELSADVLFCDRDVSKIHDGDIVIVEHIGTKAFDARVLKRYMTVRRAAK